MSGEYGEGAELDGRRDATARCRVGAGPDDAVLVELGNGTISVTGGLYPRDRF